ncbi:MAG: DUF5615 family PIN-like protein [Planctomycetes bacterium]|nr:DUF5615 family PIN-like protein [Planctomycetota bacterium]
MKFKIDENLPAEIVADLRAAGHEADTVPDQGLAGSVDPVILAAVQREGRVLLTMDIGIGDIRAYPPEQYPGIVLFRLRRSGRGTSLALVRKHLPALLQSELVGHLRVVSEAGIRVR